MSVLQFCEHFHCHFKFDPKPCEKKGIHQVFVHLNLTLYIRLLDFSMQVPFYCICNLYWFILFHKSVPNSNETSFLNMCLYLCLSFYFVILPVLKEYPVYSATTELEANTMTDHLLCFTNIYWHILDCFIPKHKILWHKTCYKNNFAIDQYSFCSLIISVIFFIYFLIGLSYVYWTL